MKTVNNIVSEIFTKGLSRGDFPQLASDLSHLPPLQAAIASIKISEILMGCFDEAKKVSRFVEFLEWVVENPKPVQK